MIARTGARSRFPNAVLMRARGHWVGGGIDDDRPAVALDQDHVAGRVTNGHVDAVGHPDHFLAELVRLRPELLAPGVILARRTRACGEERVTDVRSIKRRMGSSRVRVSSG